MQSTDILRGTHFSNPATGIPLLALVHSEEINTASSGVSLLCKTLIFCEVLIFGNPATGTSLLALVHSEEINTASSGVSLLHKTLIFCAMLILATPLLEHHMSGYPHTAGTPLSALVHSEEINTASSGVSLLCKALIFCAILILATPLLECLPLLWRTLKRSALPVAG